MKFLIALILLVALVAADKGPVTLISDNSATIMIQISANSANSSNKDVAWMLDYPDTFPTEVVDVTNPVVCFSTGSSDYVVANSTTGLMLTAAMWTCSTSGSAGDCDTIAEVDTTFAQTYGVAGETTAAGAFNTGVMSANTGTFTSTVNTTTNLITRTIIGVTPAQMTSAGLPNSTQTFYYRCWGELGAATAVTLTSGISAIAGTLTAAGNATVKGSASSVGSILVVAGSLASSFAF